MFLSWWYLKANSMKSGQYGTFLCHIYFFFFFFLWAGRGSEHFVPVTWFLSWSRVNESSSMSPFQIFPWKKTLHTTIITKIFHVRDVLECKTWIPHPPPLLPFLPFTHLLVTSILESGFMNWTISCFCFLRHGSPSQFVLCQLYPQSPAFLVLPTMHTCLICPLVS